MREVQLSSRKYDVALTGSDKSLNNLPKLELPEIHIKLPKWTRWIVRMVVRPLIPTIFSALRPLFNTVVTWLWAVGYRVSLHSMPVSMPVTVSDVISAWLDDLEAEILAAF